MKNHWFTIYLGCVVLALLLFICVAAPKLQADRDRLDQTIYAGWCKLEGRSDITYDEWIALRNSGVLTRRK